MTFSFGSDFNYPILRKLWISDQLSKITEFMSFMVLTMEDIATNSLLVYNGSNDYNDTSFESNLKSISNNTIQFDTQSVISWRQNTSMVQKYSIVESGFNTFTNNIKNATIDTPSDLLIIALFLNKMTHFYYDSTDPSIVQKTILMSADDLKVHLEVYKIIANSISTMISNLKSSQQYIFMVSQNDSNHPLYNTFGNLVTSLVEWYSKMLDVTDYIDKILINQLANGIANIPDNYNTLSTKMHTATIATQVAHDSFLSIFFDSNSSTAITKTLVTSP